ncbi:MAG: tRNA preQ1(34) S-adenosylmethionine ribosyltransferase-isomerase QueA [Planctomycetes bacterium]|nr:tRNA preQ1(34) S-adenosylmethionine ribosyltransferase-isomerase QueA [Planctomycetota bacterium]
MPLRTADLDYDLPARLIATRPAEPRDSARLLVVHLGTDELEHRTVRDLPEYVTSGDRLIVNDTSVVRARIVGRRADSGGKVEGLVLDARPDAPWRVMLKSNGRLRAGLRIEIDGAPDAALVLVGRAGDGVWLVGPDPAGASWTLLESIGRTPLPPYILGARRQQDIAIDDDDDRRWYETVYADPKRRRSVAAPTAGLHFTPELLLAIDDRGVTRHPVTLHVGTGTFKPVTADTLDAHEMHTEWYEVPAPTLTALREPGRVIAVGTTAVRALESLSDPLPGADDAVIGDTNLLIAPPYTFRHVDGLMTNFHLPRSTLLALVAALVGLDRLLEIYREAVTREYRFYSYGDAMLVLP